MTNRHTNHFCISADTTDQSLDKHLYCTWADTTDLLGRPHIDICEMQVLQRSRFMWKEHIQIVMGMLTSCCPGSGRIQTSLYLCIINPLLHWFQSQWRCIKIASIIKLVHPQFKNYQRAHDNSKWIQDCCNKYGNVRNTEKYKFLNYQWIKKKKWRKNAFWIWKRQMEPRSNTMYR